ncbi:hypothetical protein [Bradyrhizobium sp. USDA 4451]
MIDADAQRFRQQAEKYRQFEQRAISGRDRDDWLRLAAEWGNLAQAVDRRQSGFNDKGAN